MNNEFTPKEKPFDFPMMPIFGVDLGERLGSMDARLARGEIDIQMLGAKIERLDAKIDAVAERLDAKIDAVAERLDAKIDAVAEKLNAKIDAVDSRVDSCLVAINRLDERSKNLSMVTWGGIIVILAAIIAQKFL